MICTDPCGPVRAISNSEESTCIEIMCDIPPVTFDDVDVAWYVWLEDIMDVLDGIIMVIAEF